MSQTNNIYKIEWLGYNEAPKFNRIWGYVKMPDGRTFAFWGAKGGRILFKRHISQRFHEHYVASIAAMQEQKGFKKIDPSHYEMICPGFHEELEIWLMTAILADDF